MKNITSRLGSIIGGYNFFQEKYLCKNETASLRFNSALCKARAYYDEHSRKKITPELIHESWQQNITALESYFVNAFDAGFMSNEVINGTMVFTNRTAHKLELKGLSMVLGKKTVEETISKNLNPAFLSGKSYKSTLINSTHHLYHLTQFEQKTGRKISSMESVVEFGGGYGNMARIVRNMSSVRSYSIIDLLLFSCIQYVFLSTVTENGIVALYDESASGQPNIFLYPLFDTDTPANITGELFLSTWALSESTRSVYEWAISRNWFGATCLLLAYNNNWRPWQEGELEESLAKNGWRIFKEPIPFLPSSYYLFATR